MEAHLNAAYIDDLNSMLQYPRSGIHTGPLKDIVQHRIRRLRLYTHALTWSICISEAMISQLLVMIR